MALTPTPYGVTVARKRNAVRGMLPCTPSQIHHEPEDAAREPRFGPLFLDSRFHDGQLRLSWSARSTLSSKIIEPRATSFELEAIGV